MANIIEHLTNILGPSVELRKSATHVQWRVAGSGSAWSDLFPLSDIQGLPGVNAVANDTATAGYIGTSGGSATQTAGDDRWGLKDSIIVRGVGIDPTGTSDSSVAVQALLLAAQSSGLELVFPPGTFILNNLTTAKMINQPRVRGMGKSTILKGTGATAADRILTFYGISGQVSGGEICDLQMTNPLGIALELHGVIAVNVIRVRFHENLIGLLFHNKDAGSFTEFCVATDCAFEAGTVTAIEYRRGAGDASFHGSGFKGAVINQGPVATTSSVMVGAGCNVYNAPWDGTFWGRVAGVSMITNNSGNVKTHGHLQFEVVVAQTIVNTASTGAVYYTGSVSRLGGGISRGLRFILSVDVSHNADGSVTAMYAPRQGAYVGQAAALNTIYVDSQTMLVAINIVATGYAYAQLLYVSPDPVTFGAGVVTVVSTARSTDTVTYGAPAWSIVAGRLIVTNSKYTAATAITIGVVSVLGGIGNPLT